MILLCTGPGKENVAVSSYTGVEYWWRRGEDPLKSKLKATPYQDEEKGTNILISGAGDGGLQDFLRLVTNWTEPRDIYYKIPVEFRPEIERRIYGVEDYAARSFVWCRGPHHDCNVLTKLHEDHNEIVNWLLASGLDADEKRQLFEDLGKLVRPVGSVKLAFRCSHFDPCFAFNRFLTLLIGRYLIEEREEDPFLVKRSLTKVVPADDAHTCKPDHPEECLLKSHVATFVPSICTDRQSDSFREQYEIVLIRHGVTSDTPNAPQPQLPRQMLPYDYPWGADLSPG